MLYVVVFSKCIYLAFNLYKGYSMKENIDNFKINKTKKWQGNAFGVDLSCVDIFWNG